MGAATIQISLGTSSVTGNVAIVRRFHQHLLLGNDLLSSMKCNISFGDETLRTSLAPTVIHALHDITVPPRSIRLVEARSPLFAENEALLEPSSSLWLDTHVHLAAAVVKPYSQRGCFYMQLMNTTDAPKTIPRGSHLATLTPNSPDHSFMVFSLRKGPAPTPPRASKTMNKEPYFANF